ncbi:MAG: hypothetical protein RLZZ46_846, partial [Bacteroidota bacterium]|jgi:enoyl-[acyl-carrier protein] reductase II
MIWCSGWELASAVSNAGGLGIIGSGSMYPQILDEQLTKCKQATQKPFAVNVPLLYPNVQEHMDLIVKHRVPIVFTSAGNPATWTNYLKEKGITVVHVVSNTKFAIKAEQAGVDALVAEGFEAGGHNGREETTTLCLIPQVRKVSKLPLIAAGGIATGEGMAAMFCLGAEGVQLGSRFVASEESSAHPAFKNTVIETKEGDTALTLKELTPVRLIRNKFFDEVQQAYQRGATKEELSLVLGRGRAKKGMFEGNLEEGELEIGQIASLLGEIRPAAEIVESLMQEFHNCLIRISGIKDTL